MAEKKKLRCGVIGLGMGSGHANEYRNHPNSELVAISDLNPARLEDAAPKFGNPKTYVDPLEMLAKENLDVLSVATPNKFHKELTIAGLKAGCHVLCEKPMAMNVEEAKAMVAAAKKADRRLMINFSYRFTAPALAMKSVVDQGTLGKVYFARTIWHRRRGIPGLGGWFSTKALSGGGPLIDLGVHRLDLALWLMGYPEPQYVLASTYNPIGTAIAKKQNKTYDVEDLAVALIKFKNGATLELEASWACNIRQNELMETRLMGTDGGLHQFNVGEGYDFDAEVFYEKNGIQFDMKPHPPIPNMGSSMAHFVTSIVNNTPHIATAEEGMTVMRLLDAVYLSAAENRPVTLK